MPEHSRSQGAMAGYQQPLLATSDEDSPLLDLIPELRNNIYHLVLAPEEDQAVNITFKEINRRTALLRTCSQIRSEATQIFYASNSFAIKDVLGYRAETDWFIKLAAANAKLIPKITTTIKLPRIFMRMLYLLFQARPDAEDAQQSIGRAYSHVLKIMHKAFEECGKSLVDGGIAGSKIEIVKCFSDWWDDRYGELVAAFEMRLTDSMLEFYTKAVGKEWSDDMQGPDTW